MNNNNNFLFGLGMALVVVFLTPVVIWALLLWWNYWVPLP
jgi:hypothetical protein